jgi:hypothetical protein
MPSAMFSIENELQRVISHLYRFAKFGVYLSVVLIDVLVYARRLTRFENYHENPSSVLLL